jgi:hypothetical protein
MGLVEIFRFDRREKLIQRYGSKGLLATRIAAGEGPVSLTCLAVEPGGVIGTHPAAGSQLFLAIDGKGWIAGPDGRPLRSERAGLSAGTQARSTPPGPTPVSSRSPSKAPRSTCSSRNPEGGYAISPPLPGRNRGCGGALKK